MARSKLDGLEVRDGLIRGFEPAFRKFDDDWEDYLDALVDLHDAGKLEKPEGVPLYVSHGEPGRAWLFDRYFERGLYDLLEAELTTTGDAFFATIFTGTRQHCERLAALGEAVRARRIWRSHVAGVKSTWWWYVAYRKAGFRFEPNYLQPEVVQRQKYDEVIEGIPEKKRVMLEVLAEFRDFAVATGAPPADLARIDRDIADVEAEARSRPAGPIDKREMTEDVFWELIGDSSEPAADRLEGLADRLSRFRAAPIRRFDAILRDLDARVLRTDVWALAYLLQRGCSDDAFDEFRGWLILQGRQVFEAVLSDPDSFDTTLHPGGSAGGMSALRDAAPAAYDMRQGKPMKPNRTSPAELAGPDWEEHEFEARLPRIAAALETRE